jgi:hypothetical protein
VQLERHRVPGGDARVRDLLAQPARERLLAQRRAGLLEAHRLEVEERDASDGRRHVRVAQREVEQRSRADHRQLGQLLGEPAQPGEHLGRRLDLIEE